MIVRWRAKIKIGFKNRKKNHKATETTTKYNNKTTNIYIYNIYICVVYPFVENFIPVSFLCSPSFHGLLWMWATWLVLLCKCVRERDRKRERKRKRKCCFMRMSFCIVNYLSGVKQVKHIVGIGDENWGHIGMGIWQKLIQSKNERNKRVRRFNKIFSWLS